MLFNLIKDKPKINLLEGGSKSPLTQSKFFIGSMGTGKTVACCMEIARLMISTERLCIVFDPLKGARDADNFLSSPQFLNTSGMTELDFLDCCEGWIAGAKNINENPSLDISRLLGNGPRKSVIYIEEFHAIQDQSRISRLIKQGEEKGINFYLASQRSQNSNGNSFDFNLVNKYVFKTNESDSIFLLGNKSASELTSSDRGRCINSELNEKEFFKYIPDLDFKKAISQISIPQSFTNDLKFSFK